MKKLIGKTIKNFEITKGVPYFIFEDGSVVCVNMCLSKDLSKSCVNELNKSIAEGKTYLFTALRDN